MTSVVRDFEPRDRAQTTGSQGVPLAPFATVSPTSPVDGRASTTSRHSRVSSSDPAGRFKRTATVTTYHHPEANDPVWQPGAEPGIDPSAGEDRIPPEVKNLKARCEINIIDFSDSDVRHIFANNESLEKIVASPRPDDMPCRWISVNGLSWDVIKCLGKRFHFHRLAIEDVVKTRSRTKVDWYADHACIILTLQKLVRLHRHKGSDAQCDCADRHLDKYGRAKGQKFWQSRPQMPRQQSELPYYLDKDGDGVIDEFVNAHSGTSTDAPIKPVRTLHRYESAQIPEHTAFMEKHSTLAAEDLAVSVEQVAIFLLADNTVISFFEQSAEDVESPIRERLQSVETILRRSCDGSLLCEAIIDAIVDLAVPVKDAYNKARKELQVDAMINPNIGTSRSLHIFGEEIDMLQNLFKPIVHLVNALRDHNTDPLPPQPVPAPSDGGGPEDRPTSLRMEKAPRDREGAPVYIRKTSDFRRLGPSKSRAGPITNVVITPLTHTYLGDVLDHCITLIQAFEQMDASAVNISTLIFNTVGAKTNNFMMILAMVTVFFAPLTFVSGYFGMNFGSGNGLKHPFSFFWVVAVPVLIIFMIVVFMTMLWDNIKDWFAKRGIRSHRRERNRVRRSHGYF